MNIDRFLKITLILIFYQVFLHAGDWVEVPSMLTPRGGASAVYYDGKIYVFGGKSLQNKLLNTVEVYHVHSGIWDTLTVPKFQTARYNAKAIVYDDLIYLIGGRDQEKALKSCEVFDPAQNMWVAVQDLRREREGMGAAYFNDRIYVVGGQRDEKMIEEVEWYDDFNHEWLDAVFDLPFPRSAFFSGVVQDTFYLFGGYYYGLTKNIYKAVPGVNGYQWISAGELECGIAYGASVTIGDEIFLIGGETKYGKTDHVQIFNTKSNQIRHLEPLRTARSGLTSVVAEDSLIFAIGGFEGDYNIPVNIVEVYTNHVTALEKDPLPSVAENSILIRGYPNPFNGQISLKIDVPKNGKYQLKIFNVRGQIVHQMGEQYLKKGTNILNWHPQEQLASGIYFLVVHNQSLLQKFKMIYAK